MAPPRRSSATPGPGTPRSLLGLATLGLLICLAGSGPAVPAVQPEADARKTEAELQAVKAEIERVTRQVSEEQVERDYLGSAASVQ